MRRPPPTDFPDQDRLTRFCSRRRCWWVFVAASPPTRVQTQEGTQPAGVMEFIKFIKRVGAALALATLADSDADDKPLGTAAAV